MQKGEVVKVIATGKIAEVLNDGMCLVTLHAVDVPMLTSQIEAANALDDLVITALYTDGAHHKQWYLYQIAEKLGLAVDSITDDKGIAP